MSFAKCVFVCCSILYLLLILSNDVDADELPQTDCLHEVAINVGVNTVNSTVVYNTSCFTPAITTTEPTPTTPTTTNTTTLTTTTTVPTTTSTIPTPTTTTTTPTTSTVIPTAPTTTTPMATKLAANCGKHFILLGGQCYYFSNTKISWHDALKACRNLGADLAHPIDFGQFSNIKNHLAELSGTTNPEYSSYWLGATDETEEGKWVWIHDKSPIFYSEWTYKPDEDTGDCLQIREQPGIYKWYGFECSMLSHFICQLP